MSSTLDSRSFFGGDAGFAVQYPLYALKRVKDKYLGYPMGPEWPRPDAVGIPVFTSPTTVVRFLTHTRMRARVKEFDRVAMFRMFLRPLRDQGAAILFDLLPDGKGELHSSHVFSAGTVLERFLPEAAWGWSYPVFVLRFQNREDWACVDAKSTEGKPGSWLVVLTDADLADRAVAGAPVEQPLSAVPANKEEFLRIVRSMTRISGAIFDPPDRLRGGVARWVVPRRTLISNLEMEL